MEPEDQFFATECSAPEAEIKETRRTSKQGSKGKKK
jgi:hypothetical protein